MLTWAISAAFIISTMLIRNVLVVLHNISLSGDMMLIKLLYKSILVKSGHLSQNVCNIISWALVNPFRTVQDMTKRHHHNLDQIGSEI